MASRGPYSAEGAGSDTMTISYVVAATRPIGSILLALLFVALLKPAIGPALEQYF